MFLLVSVRHVEAHPGEHQHGVSTQISISLGKTFFPISCIRKDLCTCTSFHLPDSGLYLLNGFDFYSDLFWMAWHWKPAIFSVFLSFVFAGHIGHIGHNFSGKQYVAASLEVVRWRSRLCIGLRKCTLDFKWQGWSKEISWAWTFRFRDCFWKEKLTSVFWEGLEEVEFILGIQNHLKIRGSILARSSINKLQ